MGYGEREAVAVAVAPAKGNQIDLVSWTLGQSHPIIK